MNDNELYEILQSYKAALDALIDQNEAIKNEMAQMREQYTAEIDSLKKTLFEDILNPAQEAMNKAEYEKRFADFNDRYGERLAPLVNPAKALEGNDYDLTREVFDNYDKMEEKPDEEAYVETAIEAISKQIEEVKQALGAEKVEVKSDEDGDIKIEADGEDVTKEVLNGELPEGGEGATETPEGGEGAEEYPEDSPEDIEALEKELEAYKG